MKKFHKLAILVVITVVSIAPLQGQTLSQFEAVKARVFSKPYDSLPQYKVSKEHFGKSGDHPDNHLLKAARRTLVSRADFIDRPEGQKLLNANGICLAGEWHITQSSAYTGLFKQGSKVPVIVRASVALSGTNQSDKRAFGLAVKLFPGSNDSQTGASLNVFLLNSLVGVRVKHVLDLPMTNAPSAKGIPAWSQISTALRLRNDLEHADKEHGTGEPQLAYRTVEHVAAPTQGASNADNIVSPYWLRLRANPSMPRIDAKDFRNELAVSNYSNNTLIWNIEAASNYQPMPADSEVKVAPSAKKKINHHKDAQWQLLGQLVLTESVVSLVCDQKLHFAHPVTRNF